MSVSTYVLTDGAETIVQYPWSLDQMIAANPTVSFPMPVTDEIAAQFNTFPVVDVPQPTIDPMWQNVTLVNPIYENGIWVEQWLVTQITPEEHDVRVAAYRSSLQCTPLQGKIELNNEGLLNAAEQAVAAADKNTQLAWTNAVMWYRTSPLIETMGAALGLTPDELDNLFVQAAKIFV